MKVILKVADDKASFLLELLNNFSFVKLESETDDFNDEKEVKCALKNASLIKQNKLKARPAKELLNEL